MRIQRGWVRWTGCWFIVTPCEIVCSSEPSLAERSCGCGAVFSAFVNVCTGWQLFRWTSVAIRRSRSERCCGHIRIEYIVVDWNGLYVVCFDGEQSLLYWVLEWLNGSEWGDLFVKWISLNLVVVSCEWCSLYGFTCESVVVTDYFDW